MKKTVNEFYIPISSINTYVFCPRRFYIEYFLGFNTDNYYTIEGKSIESQNEFYGQNGRYYKKIYVVSHKLKIEGTIDILIENDNEWTIVEQKRGYKGNWKNDYYQLLAQIIAFEETTGIEISQAFVYYFSSKKRIRLEKNLDNIENLKIILENMKSILNENKKPEITFTNKCIGCSEYEICLPEGIFCQELYKNDN